MEKTKGQASASHTPAQVLQLEDAVDSLYVSVDASDPFSLFLLEAAKTNTELKHLTVVMKDKKKPTEFLDALANFLVTHPPIELDLWFNQSIYQLAYSDTVRDDEDTDDYTKLVTVMIGSQSLHNIFVNDFLAVKLVEAVMEVLNRNSTSISLNVFESSFISLHPIAFGEMLGTTNCLSELHLGYRAVGHQQYDRSHIRDGLVKNQSLKVIMVQSTDCLCNDILRSVDGIQSLERLWISQRLDSTTALLLNKFVSKHKNLATLYVDVAPDAVEALCDAVLCSQSLRSLKLDCHSHESAISRMLQQSTSLRNIDLSSSVNKIDFKKLAVGLETSKSLTTLHAYQTGSDVSGYEARPLLKAVIVNHNIANIYAEGVELCIGGKKVKRRPGIKIFMETAFYLSFNRQGRALLGDNAPLGVWPYALEKAGSSSLPDALYFFLQEKPELFMHHSLSHEFKNQGCCLWKPICLIFLQTTKNMKKWLLSHWPG